MNIKVLGTGCPKCNSLEKLTRKAVKESGIDAEIEKVEDIMKIMEYGIMKTPALVINGEVKISGRLPSEKELKEFLTL
ncbi:MAG: TM0996/MTH895 family glutaredoxin-like protein [Bacteroidetes bacterium]|nr:TM0996/MTH895 family glutaredoxin-like protein [Bacteroidota bacterium]MCK5764888.1 TM0996/MTH895 family glutaredoxin-like protein [Bacteroidales bacterium]